MWLRWSDGGRWAVRLAQRKRRRGKRRIEIRYVRTRRSGPTRTRTRLQSRTRDGSITIEIASTSTSDNGEKRILIKYEKRGSVDESAIPVEISESMRRILKSLEQRHYGTTIRILKNIERELEIGTRPTRSGQRKFGMLGEKRIQKMYERR